MLKRAYRILYREGVKLEMALDRIEAEIPGEAARELVRFVQGSRREFAGKDKESS